MMIYIVTLIAIALYGCICFSKGTTTLRKIAFLSISFCHFWIIMAMRNYEVGNDTWSYYKYFLRWGESQAQVGGATQPVYYLYNRVIYAIAPYGQAIIICNSLLEVIGIALFIYHFSENVFLSTYLWVTLYFFCESMNIARQFLALALCMIAFVYLWKQNNIKMTLLFYLLAIGIHSLAITLIPIFLVKFICLTQKKILAIATGGMVFSLLFDKLFMVLINAFCVIFPYYNQYLIMGKFNVYNEGGSRNVLLVLFYLAFVVTALFLLEDRTLSAERKNNIIILLVPCIITVAIGLGAINIISVQRVKMLYSAFFICLIPNVIGCLNRKNRIIADIFVMLITLLPFGVQLLGNYGGVVPYRFFWQ